MTKPDAGRPRRAPRERTVSDHPTSEAWLRFLAAERAGREAEAEAALATLFAALPPAAPRPGFAERVMARIAPRSIFALPSTRFGVAAALVLAALSAAFLAPMALELAGLVSLADLIGGGVRGLASVTVRLATALAGWESVGQLVAAVGRGLLQPANLPFVLTPFAVAALALRGLVRIARFERSTNHAVLR